MAQAVLAPGASPVRLGDVGAGEGPAWSPKGELFFTGRGKIWRRDPQGRIAIFRAEPHTANGLLFDRQGRLVACETTNRRITRTEKDGRVTILADRYEGKRFNSPNDLTVDSRGRIYFTDPRYGPRTGMEMTEEAVYRIDAPGQVTRVLAAPDVERPNGILVSPRDEFLYVADNHNNRVGGARKLYRFALNAGGNVDPASRRVIYDWRDGRGPDGVKMDQAGRLYVAGGLTKPNPPFEPSTSVKGGIYVLSPEGKLLAFIPAPVDEVTNCAFGGPDGKTLFITAGGTLWSIPVLTAGRVPWGIW